MALQILGTEPRRKLLFGVVLPVAIVAPIVALGTVRPGLAFAGLLGSGILGGSLYMINATDQRAESFASRATRGGSTSVGIDAGAKPHEEIQSPLSRLGGTLQVFGAGLGVVAFLGLGLFSVVV